MDASDIAKKGAVADPAAKDVRLIILLMMEVWDGKTKIAEALMQDYGFEDEFKKTATQLEEERKRAAEKAEKEPPAKAVQKPEPEKPKQAAEKQKAPKKSAQKPPKKGKPKKAAKEAGSAR